MNCAEFRRRYQSLLDERVAESLPAGMAAHVTLCPACASLATALAGVDRALRSQPRLPLPDALARDLTTIPLKSMRAEFSLARTLAKGIAMAVPAATVLALGMALLPPERFLWMRLSLLTAGLAYFWINVLKQKRLAVSLE
jgi:hypothetical protein